jgi:hypothetical protein
MLSGWLLYLSSLPQSPFNANFYLFKMSGTSHVWLEGLKAWMPEGQEAWWLVE